MNKPNHSRVLPQLHAHEVCLFYTYSYRALFFGVAMVLTVLFFEHVLENAVTKRLLAPWFDAQFQAQWQFYQRVFGVVFLALAIASLGVLILLWVKNEIRCRQCHDRT